MRDRKASLCEKVLELLAESNVSARDRTVVLKALEQALEHELEHERPSLSNPVPLDMAADGFQPIKTLGSGGMGDVYRIQDPVFNRTLAMKVIRTEHQGDEQVLSRFLAEAQATAQLQHPGIVPVHHLGQMPDGRWYFTMTEVRGQTLREVIDAVHRASPDREWGVAPGDWTFRRLIHAFQKICEAVAFAHSRGVLHRDLKPQNVMVGEYGEVLVLDWGLARIQALSEDSTSDPASGIFASGTTASVTTVPPRAGKSAPMTQAGAVPGTPAYMAPEQARGELEHIGPATDVYGLGAILYEILSARPPYQGVDGWSVVMQVLAGPPMAPGRRHPVGRDLPTEVGPRDASRSLPLVQPAQAGPIGPPLPEPLVQLCLRAMARNPVDRFPDANTLAQEVNAWLDDALRRDRALKHIQQADQLMPEVARYREEAQQQRQQAQQHLESVRPCEPVDRKRPAWHLEDNAEMLEREADLLEIEYLQTLRTALTLAPGLEDADARLAAYYQTQLADAEKRAQTRQVLQYDRLLAGHDRGEYRAWRRGDGAFTLFTDPPGAVGVLHGYELQDRRLVAVPIQRIESTPMKGLTLPMGSYLLTLDAPGRRTVRYPFRIGRQEHWDGVPPAQSHSQSIPHSIYLPRIDELGENEVYIPPGWFLSGGDPDAYNGLPQRRVWLDGFVIGRFPVTNAQYLEFLNDLVRQGRMEEALAAVPLEKHLAVGALRQSGYHQGEDGLFHLGIDPTGTLWQADWPVFMIDLPAGLAYTRWLAERTGLDWRLPGELEWEKAARGCDGRFFPWGNVSEATWACCIDSHPGTPMFPGIDSYPQDESPYGVRGMAGGTTDVCADAFSPSGPTIQGDRVLPGRGVGTGDFCVLRGGNWISPLKAQRVCSRYRVDPTIRQAQSGIRLVRSFPAPPRFAPGNYSPRERRLNS